MELQALPFVRASHTVTREEKGPRPTPPTFNEANTSSGAVVYSRGVISNSNSAPSSMFASVVTQSPWSTSVRVSRTVPSCSSNGVEGGDPQLKAQLSLQVLPRPSQLRSRGGKARLRKRGVEGTPAIVDHLAQLRRKEQGFSTGYFGAPHEESCAYDDPSIASSAAERDFQMVPSSPSLKRLCTSAEGAWLGVKQPTHAASNSMLEPALQQLPLEDTPSQLDDNWALFSAPQEGIKWGSGGPFLQTCGEGHEPHLNVGSGCDPVAGPQGAHTRTSFVVDGVLPPWEPRSCEDPSLPPVSFDALPASQLEEGEGEDVLQQQSRNTDQASFWLCDCSAGDEEGGVTVGLGGSRSIGRSTDPQHLFSVPSVPTDEEDDYPSYISNSSTQQRRHFGCNQEESPLIPWEE